MFKFFAKRKLRKLLNSPKYKFRTVTPLVRRRRQEPGEYPDAPV